MKLLGNPITELLIADILIYTYKYKCYFIVIFQAYFYEHYLIASRNISQPHHMNFDN